MSDEDLMQPFKHIASVPGKSLRWMLIDAVNRWLQIPAVVVVTIKEIVDKLHSASVLIQDIEGHSRMRRGIPVAHSIYGIPSTLNCANLVYFLAFEQICKLGRPAGVEAYRAEMELLHRGQGQDILWRDASCEVPTEEEYKQVAVWKSGWIFRLALKLMLACSDVPISGAKFMPMVDHFAVYFQIRDDYMNLTAPQYNEGKAYCEDITEGKYSFLVIHSIRSAYPDDKLVRILRQRTRNVSLLKYALELMKATRSFDYCKQVLDQHFLRVLEYVQGLGGNPALVAVVQRLHTTIPEPSCALEEMAQWALTHPDPQGRTSP
eukprot:RCo039768